LSRNQTEGKILAQKETE